MLSSAIALAIACFALGARYASASSDKTFVNVADTVGVSYVQWRPAPASLTVSPQVMTGGAAVADYDGDGWPDLLVTRYRDTDVLFRNRGDGSFENVSDRAGFDFVAPSNGAGWGDIDNDGDPDLFLTVADETAGSLGNLLFVNHGDSTFSEQALPRGARSQAAHWHSGFSPCFGDYDRDGWLDIHTCQWSVIGPRNRSVLFRNLGEGQFQDHTAAAGVEMWHSPSTGSPPRPNSHAFTSRLSDIDGDGWPDLVVAGDFGTSRMFWNNRDGTFSDGTRHAEIGSDENGMGLAVGDYDGDGLFDLFFTSIYDARGPDQLGIGWGVTGNRLYRNLGDRRFEDTTSAAGVRDGGWGWGAVFFDYDNDGDLDLAMTNGFDSDKSEIETPFHSDPTKLWRNDGGTFVDVSAAEGITDTGSGKGLLVFDYDKDGDLDLFIVNNADAPILYRNESANGNHWLRVKPRGRYSNRDGIGTLVTISTHDGGRQQRREIGGGSHYLTQGERVAHFGLGEAASIVDLVTIRWPSGIEQRFTDVAVDQVLELTEPATPYQAWIDEHFTQAERTTGELTAPPADPDADRWSNSLEFGCGLDPRETENKQPIEVSGVGATGELTVRYRRRNLPRGVRVTLEKSADLTTWQACDDDDVRLVSIGDEDDWGVETVTVRLLSAGDGQALPRHVRLKVALTD